MINQGPLNPKTNRLSSRTRRHFLSSCSSPSSLQIMVWLERLTKPSPSIHFVTAVFYQEATISDPVRHFTLEAVPQSMDASTCCRDAGIGTVCPSAARALRIACGGKAGVLGCLHAMNKKTDILCLENDIIRPPSKSLARRQQPVILGLEKSAYVESLYFPKSSIAAPISRRSSWSSS